MQTMNFSKFMRQLGVLIQRNFRLILNDKLVLGSLLLQAPLMVGVIKLVCDPACFTSNLVNVGSRTALFIICAMGAFMGTLNSYREICKEREIIFREASVGISLPAVVLSKFIVLLLVDLVHAVIMSVGFCRIITIPENHLLLDTELEIFISMFLVLAASSAIGLLISASLKSSESAILLVLVLMIGQVVFSGVMFTLKGAMIVFSYVIVTRWGMAAMGASTDINSRMDWLGLGDSMYESTSLNLVHCWQMLGLLCLVCIVAAWLVLQIAFNKRKE